MKKSIDKISAPGVSKLQSLLHLSEFLFTGPGQKVFKNAVKKKLGKSGIIKEKEIDYNQWILARESPKEMEISKRLTDQFFTTKLPISILLPVHGNPEVEHLKMVISAILGQTYENWKLTIAYGPSIGPATRLLLQDYNKTEQRIHAIESQSATVLSSNIDDEFLRFAGDYVLIMDRHYILAPDSLLQFVARAIALSAHVVYADEDELGADGKYGKPIFKPGWSPDYLLTHNYIGDIIFIDTLILKRLRETLRQSQTAYDLIFSIRIITSNFYNVPKVLVHKILATIDENDAISNNMTVRKAIEKKVANSSLPITVEDIPGIAGKYRVRYGMTDKKKVSIIIPTKDQVAFLKRTIDSILQKTDYPDYEIIIVNNNSADPAFFQLIKDYNEKHPGVFICIDANIPFNFSKLINLGAAVSSGKYLLLLNNDVEVIQGNWLTEMAAYLDKAGVAAVGPKLLYPNNTIQHAGIALGGSDGAFHVFAGKPKDNNGYNDRLKTVNNYAALTAACLMCKKSTFEMVGGMDEGYVVEYSDFDLCLKLLQTGFHNVYLPDVELYHYESATRGHPFRNKKAWQQHQKDLFIFKQKWLAYIDEDPWYNPNLRLKFKGMELG